MAKGVKRGDGERRSVHGEGLTVGAVAPGSIAEELGVAAGDRICAVDGRPLADVIDYRFALAGEHLEILVRRQDGEEWLLEIDKDYDEDLGLTFAEPFGRLRRCANRCIFCFLDQMPPGLRPSLYVNDDDYRLSFWEGNFTTLTNAGPRDLARIAAQRLSPLYVSVHATDPALRRRMLGHPRAGKILDQLAFLKRHGIALHTQIVLCPGINDGPALEQTVRDLGTLAPAVQSIAIVPVGLTRFREGLFPLRRFTSEEALGIIASVERRQKEFEHRYGTPLVFAADEFYLLAGKPVPAPAVYGDFPQLENGIGLVRCFLNEAGEALAARLRLQGYSSAVAVTGTLAFDLIHDFAYRLREAGGPRLTVIPVENTFFGPGVTVAGLLTARDVVHALDGLSRREPVILPAAMFNETGLTLDDRTAADIAEDLGVPVHLAGSPRELLQLLGETR